MNIRTLYLNTWFTIVDELHHKSFYILTIIAVLFTITLRGCFTGNYVVNGEQVNGITVGWHASIIGFQIVAFGGLLIGILLSMRSFTRDRDNGIIVAILSKPVRRIEYVTSKAIGLWTLSYGLTFILHFTIYIIMLFNTGGRLGWFFPASLITSINILAGIMIILMLSLVLPDVLAALSGIVITFVSLIVDSVYAASRTDTVQNIINQVGAQDRGAWWVWTIWPKIAALQYFASSLIKQSTFHVFGPFHPILNVLIYAGISYLLMILIFNKREIL